MLKVMASWAVVAFLVWLITLCFGLPYSIPAATGVWMILLLLGMVFGRSIN